MSLMSSRLTNYLKSDRTAVSEEDAVPLTIDDLLLV
jgi:hypothetical protein